MTDRGITTHLACALLLFLAPAPMAFAQSQAIGASIEGIVSDQSGAVVAGVTVEVLRPATNWSRMAITDGSGRYVIPGIPVGTYQVTASLAGFQTVKYENIPLTVGASVTLNINMKVAATSQEVTVSAEAPLIESTRPTYQQTLNTRSLTNLPIIARNFETFVFLTPGTVQSARNTQSIGGQKGINSNFMVDGADRNNPFFGGQVGGDRPPFSISMEAIREFVVLNNGFNAEFGRSGAGLVNVVTKSGTNDFHGKGWYYIADSSFQTVDAFGAVPAGRRQQFGGDFGGRLVKDKLFFYVNSDNQRRDVPLEFRMNNRQTLLNAQNSASANERDAAKALLAAEGPGSGTDHLRSLLGKVDWALTRNNTLSGRYNYHRSEQANGTHGFNPVGITVYAGSPTFFGSELDRNHATALQLNSVITPRQLNELRFHYNWEDRPRLQNPIPGTTTVNGVSDGAAVVVSGITSSRPGLGAVDFLPIPETDTRTQVTENYTYVFGKHDTKFGVDYNRSTVDQVFRGNARGVFTFDNFTNFVNRTPNRYRQFFGSGVLATDVHEWAVYAQDNWKVRPNLTVNYGVRWEAQINPNSEAPNTDFPGTTTKIPDDKKMFGPRLGIAWSPSKKAVVRLYSGYFFARTPMLLFSSPLTTNGNAFGFTLDVSTGNPLMPAFTYPHAGPYLTPFDKNPSPPANASGTQNRADIRAMPSNFHNSRSFRAGPSFEYELLPNFTVSASYTYAFTTGLERLHDINLFAPCTTEARNATSSASRSTFDSLCALGARIYGAGSAPGSRPISLSGFSGQTPAAFVLTESSGNSRYNAVTIAATKRWSNRMQFQAFYTWSRTLSHDDNERDASARNFYDVFADLDWGRSILDVPHNFVLNGVWELPWGFQLSPIVFWRSGFPINPVVQTDALSLAAPPAAVVTLIRDRLGKPNASIVATGNGDGNSTTDRPLVDGRVIERNAFRQGPSFQTDLRAAKIFRFADSQHLEAFIDFINLFDNDNLQTSNTNVRNTTFLVKNRAGVSFQFQLGFKYVF